MKMNNSVSSRLTEKTADEIVKYLYKPYMDSFDEVDLERMCALNEAYVVVLARQKLITDEIAKQLLVGIQHLRDVGVGKIDTNPQYEDSYFAFENTLSQLLGASVTGWIHVGRSRNDLGATLDRMAARDICLAIQEQLLCFRKVLLEKAAEHAYTLMPGYTHLQPAQPSTFGFLLLNIAAAMERDFEKLDQAYDRTNLCSLGAAAFAGTSFDIDRQAIADLLGFDGIVSPGIEAVASRDFVSELLAIVTTSQAMISRVAGDFHIYCSAEFDILRFPDSVAGTSSIMPQKKNMFILEFLRGEAARSIGALTSTLTSVKGCNYSICWDATRSGVTDAWPALERFASNLSLLSLVVSSAEVSDSLTDRCATNFSTVTDLADGLVREHGVSFREAHHIAGDAVQATIAKGGDATALNAEILEQAVRKELGRTLDFSEADIRRWMNPLSGVEARTTIGGAAPLEVKRQIEDRIAALKKDEVILHRRNRKVTEAHTRLEQTTKAVLST